MCLSKVLAAYPEPEERELSGWKVFYREPNGSLQSLFYGAVRWPAGLPIGTWVHERAGRIDPSERVGPPRFGTRVSRQPTYHLGWHVFRTRRAAEAYRCAEHEAEVVRRVRYRKMVVRGRQEGYRVDVALELFIEPEPHISERGDTRCLRPASRSSPTRSTP